MKLLFIEPDEYYQQKFQEVFGSTGEVKIFPSARESLKILGDFTPDAIITELLLSDLTGYELLETLRRDYPQLPVIFHTAADNLQDVEAALRLGIVHFVHKHPNSLLELKNLLFNQIHGI